MKTELYLFFISLERWVWDGKAQGVSAYDMLCSKTEAELHLQKSLIKASRHQGTSEPEENSCLWWTSKLWFWPVISRWHFCICFPTEWERGLYLWTSARLCSRKSRVYFMKLPLCSAGMEYLYIAVSLVCRLRIHHCWRNAWKGPWSLLNIAEGTIIPYAAALFSMRPVLISYCP